MRLVTFSTGEGAPRCGALLGTGDVLDFCSAAVGTPQPPHHLGWFDLDSPACTEASKAHAAATADPGFGARLARAGAVVAASAARLLAPVPRPGKVICIGLNYRDHAAESGVEPPERPLLFSKFPTSIVGPEAEVRIPPGSAQVDYEAELAIVIGRRASRVQPRDAISHVLGYSNFNDVSARDFQFADTQWQRGKSCDTFAPIGPYVATTDEIVDPHRLRISFRLNGETLQDSNTDQLIFGVPDLVAFISQTITLEPGDVIASGTPSGVGFARNPPVFVRAGDRMEVEIQGLGILRNVVVVS